MTPYGIFIIFFRKKIFACKISQKSRTARTSSWDIRGMKWDWNYHPN